MSPVREQLRANTPPDNGFWLTLLRTGLGLQVILYTWSFEMTGLFFSGSRFRFLKLAWVKSSFLQRQAGLPASAGWSASGRLGPFEPAGVVLWEYLTAFGFCPAVFFSPDSSPAWPPSWPGFFIFAKREEWGTSNFGVVLHHHRLVLSHDRSTSIDSQLIQSYGSRGCRIPERLGFHRPSSSASHLLDLFLVVSQSP